MSKDHAELILEASGKPYSYLYLFDKSKFGSFRNGERVASQEKILIASGDILQFGTNNITQIKVEARPLCFCLTSMKNDEKRELTKKIQSFGAKHSPFRVSSFIPSLPPILF